MNASSSAYITCKIGENKYTWHFTGVTSIEHSLALNVDNAASQGQDIVNGARNLPDRVTLSVVETDAEHSPGWAARMLEIMTSLKKNRILCSVVTSMGTYKKMLLSEISATQDEENQDGWKGSLTFYEYVPVSDSGSGTKAFNNSSTRTNTGTSGSRMISGTALEQLLQRAGVI